MSDEQLRTPYGVELEIPEPGMLPANAANAADDDRYPVNCVLYAATFDTGDQAVAFIEPRDRTPQVITDIDEHVHRWRTLGPDADGGWCDSSHAPWQYLFLRPTEMPPDPFVS